MNNAAQFGGAIGTTNGDNLSVYDSTFISNSAFAGGAIYTEFSSVELRDSVLSYNSATVSGTAISVFTDSTCNVCDSTIEHSTGAAAVEALVEGSVTLVRTLLNDHDTCLSLFSAGGTTLDATALLACRTRAIDSVDTVNFGMNKCVVRESGSPTS